MRHQAANRDAGEVVEQRHDRIEDRAADVLEVHVDAVGTGGTQLVGEVRRTVVQRHVETECIAQVGTLGLAASDADGPGALQFRDLSHRRADRAAGRGDHDGFARLRLGDLVQAHIRGETGHAIHAQCGGQRHGTRIQPALKQAAIGDDMRLPAAVRQHHVAGAEVRMARIDHFRHRAAVHHLADLDRLGVGTAGIHAAAHVRVQREVAVAQQHLALAGHRQRHVFHTEVVGGRLAARTRGQHDAGVLRGVVGSHERSPGQPGQAV